MQANLGKIAVKFGLGPSTHPDLRIAVAPAAGDPAPRYDRAMMNQTVCATAPPADLLAAVRAAKSPVLIGHVTPDADCLGSIGALWLALPELGLRPEVAMPPGSVARRLQFLVEMAGWKAGSAADLAACDAALVVDTAKAGRANIEGKLAAIPQATVLNVDHHASNEGFGRSNWVDAGRSSACEMVYELLVGLGCQITPTVATLLYAGVHSDTRGFSLPNTTPRSLEVAAELSRRGARIAELCEQLTRSHNQGEFRLLQIVYGNTRVSQDGRLAWSSADHAEIASTGCGPSDVDDQVEIPRSIAGIDLAIFFSEANRGKVRMNFRGERGTPALPLAQQFGGGGHRLAAGAILDGTLPEVVERVTAAARRYLAELPQPA